MAEERESPVAEKELAAIYYFFSEEILNYECLPVSPEIVDSGLLRLCVRRSIQGRNDSS